MTFEAQQLCNVLLEHHRGYRRSHGDRPIRREHIGEYTIPYGRLCELAGLEYLTHPVGQFLQEIAQWCERNGRPPLNSLAVNKETGQPGDGYDTAPGCGGQPWWELAEQCIRFEGYPERVAE